MNTSIKKAARSLALLTAALTPLLAGAGNTFNPANNQIAMSAVTVGTTLYTNAVVTIGQVIKVGGGTAAATLPSYDSVRNQLTLPSVTVGSVTYSNVVVSVASVTSVAGSSTITLPTVGATLGLSWPVAKFEAEAGTLSGTAVVVGNADGSSRTIGDLAGEASGRQAVTLKATGDAVAWSVPTAQAGANAFVMRYSIPDAPGGGGAASTMDLVVTDSSGKTRLQKTLNLTSRYAWLYGAGVDGGGKLYNVSANASLNTTGKNADPIHIYDELQLMLNVPLQAGDVVKLIKTANSVAATVTVDFVELETVPAPLPQPSGYLSITDAKCGALALDARGTGSAFDGQDDTSYGSVFNVAVGGNPNFSWGFDTLEKGYYSNDVAKDSLQDNAPNAAAGGLSMYQLADRNLASINTCLTIVSASNSGYLGVYIPAGRFYARGRVTVPNNTSIQGAGMWYSKFTAVNTAPPVATTVNGLAGISSTSGNISFGTRSTGDGISLANFSVFGNLIQRQTLDVLHPVSVYGQFTNTVLDNLWMEHVFSAIITYGNSDGVRVSNTRSRNTFSDGQSFYGNTKNSSFTNSSSRSNGDDGFALWAQGTTAATTSTGNSAVNAVAELQWFGNGLTIYGGFGNKIINSTASDVLSMTCLMITTQYSGAALPDTVLMTGSASDLTLTRCGGFGFNQRWGAVMVGALDKTIDGISLNRIKIVNPTYFGFDFRPMGGNPNPLAFSKNVVVNDVLVIAPPSCANVSFKTNGSAQFNNVCSCASASSTPSACTVTNNALATFTLSPNTCSASACK
jgi:hypothetical protein